MTIASDPTFLACAAAVLVGAVIQGIGGIGFAMFAAPIVALLRPDLVPAPMIVVGGSVSLLAAVREAAHIDWKAAAIAVGGRVPGSVLAGLVIGLAPRSTFALAFALSILIAVGLSATGWRVRATPVSLAIAGFGSGVMGTITSVGAPPIGIAMQNVQPPRLRATVGAFLFMGALVSLAVLAWAGRFGVRDFVLGLQLLIPMALGFWISSMVMHRVHAKIVRHLVLAVSALSAVVLLVRGG
jgi:uncharacterized protein